MNNKNTVLSLKGTCQHYQWGGFTYIPQLLGISNEKHEPFAEYWLGAHANAPAILPDGQALNVFFEQHPALLGRQVQQAFGRLPYLLKVLDVKDMLSIQVHPDKPSALKEFKRENDAGIALTDAKRNYKDDNHKPELMTALSDFWLLHGFLTPELLLANLQRVPEFSFMLPVFNHGNYKALYEMLMTMEQSRVNEVLTPLLNRIIPMYRAGNLNKMSPDFWAARAALTFNTADRVDRGIFSIYLFNIVFLKKDEAVFQDAGILHAYLEGQNVEIMANSDNVLRGGLTPKHIDVQELMKHVLFEPVVPNVLQGKAVNKAEVVFATPAPDFELSKIVLSAGDQHEWQMETADIFLLLEGVVTVGKGTEEQSFAKGEAFLATSGSQVSIHASKDAVLYKATVPTQR
ncbi:MAG TPA: mannose-6-phosphate isomerase, class I [Chitinophagaceae bacterium]|nr:mannose-6-phosphate isomerase, class I [Chitinophagaceae bacterium]